MKKGNFRLSELFNRRTSKASTQILVVLASIVLALLVGLVILLLQGEDPVAVYRQLFIVPFSSVKGLVKVMSKVTPLLLAGLACAIAFKGNIWNIGVEGQLYIGALTAAILGNVVSGVPAWLHIIICALGAMIVGAFFAWIPAVLKVKLNVHEVLSTVMGNHIISALVAFIVVDYFRYDGPTARTPNVLDTARLKQFMRPQQFNTAIFIALAIVVLMYFLFKKTPLGWRIDASGKNLAATRYSGIDSRKLTIFAMVASGAIAGLVGVERVLGGFGYMEINFSPGYGWDGITIAIIANNNPIGVLFVSLLMGLLAYGGTSITTMTNVPAEWVNILSALIFVFVVAGNALLMILPAIRNRRKLRKEGLVK